MIRAITESSSSSPRRCTTCSRPRTCPGRPGRGPPGTARPGWRSGATGRTRASPRSRCRRSGAGSARARLDLVVACEELGHHAVPGPVAESLAAVPALLADLRFAAAEPANSGRCGPAAAATSRTARMARRAGQRGPDRDAGRAAAAAVRRRRRRGRTGAARRARTRSAVATPGDHGTGRWTRPRLAVRRERAGSRGPPRGPGGGPRVRRSARWPAPRSCSARAGRCWRPASAHASAAHSSGGRSGRSRRSSTSSPTWRSAWSSPGRCCTRRPSRSRLMRRRQPGCLRREGRLRATPPDWRPGPHCRCTARSAIPPSTTQPVADQGPRARPGLGQPGRAPGAGAWPRSPSRVTAVELTVSERGTDRERSAGCCAQRGDARRQPADRGPGRWAPVAHGSGCARDRRGGLAIPERYGGAGAGPAEVCVVMEELGRKLTPSPMLGSAVLAAQAMLASGDDAACERLLPAIADGSSIAALAWTTRPGTGTRRARLHACEAATVRAGRRLGAGRRGALRAGRRQRPTCCWSPRGRRTAAGCSRSTRARTASPAQPRHHGRSPRLAVVRLAGAAGRRIGGDAAGARWRWPGTWPASRSAPSRRGGRSGRWS